MEVPTLSANQVKGSLSKKSPLPVKSIRRAMKSPYQTSWPVSKEDTEIKETIHRLLSPIQRRSAKILPPKVKGMTKKERSQVKNNLHMKNEKNDLRAQVLLGMNELMDGLESHSVLSAIVSEDIQPTFLINMMVDLMATHHIPFIILPKLREMTKDSLGFSCSSIGLKCVTSEDDNSHFRPLHEKIVELAHELKGSKNQTLIQCPKDGCVEQVDLLNSSRSQEFEKLYCNKKADDNNIQKDSLPLICHYADWKSKKGQLRNRKCEKLKRDVCKSDFTVETDDQLESSMVLDNGKETPVELFKANKQALAMDADHESLMDTETTLCSESQEDTDRKKSVPVKVGECTSNFNNGTRSSDENFVNGTRSTGKVSKLNVIPKSEAFPYMRTFENKHRLYLKLYKQRSVSSQGRVLPINACGKYAKAGKHKLHGKNVQKINESGDNGHPDDKVTSEDVIMFGDKTMEENLSLGCYGAVRMKETIAQPKNVKKVKTKKKPFQPRSIETASQSEDSRLKSLSQHLDAEEMCV